MSREEKETKGGKWSLFGICFDDPASNVDGGMPNPFHGFPSEMIIRNRIRETSIRVFPILEDIAHELVIERSVREVRPGRECVLGNVGGGRISQSPLVAVVEHRPVWLNIMREEDPFLPAGTVLVDLERADANLGGEGSRVAGW